MKIVYFDSDFLCTQNHVPQCLEPLNLWFLRVSVRDFFFKFSTKTKVSRSLVFIIFTDGVHSLLRGKSKRGYMKGHDSLGE